MGSKASDRQREAYAYLVDEEFTYAVMMYMANLPGKVEEVKSKHAEGYIKEPIAIMGEAVLKARECGFNLKVGIESLVPDSEADATWTEQGKEVLSKLQANWQLRIDLLAKVWIAETEEELRGILSDARKQIADAFN